MKYMSLPLVKNIEVFI